MRRWGWVALLALLCGCVQHQPPVATAPRQRRTVLTEELARTAFLRDHPGAKPLNWAIGDAAIRFHESQPMGEFILGLGGDWGNDCSDFVDCCIDEGLGVGARFRRGSKRHLLAERMELFQRFWRGATDELQPGDVLDVRHSPWYEPYPGACWHCGIVGSDGMVYDFSQLKSWSGPRYHRVTADEFQQHCGPGGDIVIQRLHWRYRYRAEPLPRATAGTVQ